MSHKYKKRDGRRRKEISEDDKILLSLLDIQSQAIQVYLLADVFFYNFAIIMFESTFSKNSNNNFNDNILLINGSGLSLIASVVLSDVSFIAYNRLREKELNKKIDYTSNAERGIAIASIYTILLFFINLIGDIELYNRSNTCKVEVDDNWISVSIIQIKAYALRFLADYISLTATLESIELVKSKYNENSNNTNNMPNPDIPVVIASILYLIQRIMLLYVSVQIYYYNYRDCKEVEGLNYLEPNILAIIGSVFGTIANIIALQSFLEIYERDIDRPIFGR